MRRRRLLVAALAVGLLTACTAGPAAEAPLPPPSASSASPAGSRWRPAVGVSWQWQLSGALDPSVDADVYDVDAELTSAAQVAELQARGRSVVCYVSVGSWEPGRPDAARFPTAVVGEPLEEFPDERWLDVRRLDVLGPLLQARLRTCREKGFDAVEPDNVDGYANRSGFPLTADDQLRFNRFVAAEAHALGLGVALKNDGEQVRELEPAFDFAVVEQCVQYDECGLYRPFLDAGKAVLAAEYEGTPADFCPVTQPLGVSAIRKNLDLDAYREPCPTSS